MEIGETLKTLDGTTVVESRVRRPVSEPVYNIEVEGDHVYRVGESGVLVHNASISNCLKKLEEPIDECNLEVDNRSTSGKVLKDKTARKPPAADEVSQADELSSQVGGQKVALARKTNNKAVDGCLDDGTPIQLTEITSSQPTRLIDKYNKTLEVAEGTWKDILLFAKTPNINKADMLDRWKKLGFNIVLFPKPSDGVISRIIVVGKDATYDLPIPP